MRLSTLRRNVTSTAMATRLSLACALGLLCSIVVAQSNTASLSGTVTDPSGAVIPSATVVITNTSTGANRKVATNGSGLYSAPALIPGVYDLSFSAKRFRTLVVNDVVLVVGQSLVQNFTLNVGTTSEQVTVTANPALVSTTSPEITSEVTGSNMRALPLNGRSWTDLAELSPGVTSIKTQAPVGATDRGTRGLGSQLSISGGRPQQNTYVLDGININDYSNAGPGSVLGGNLGVDALQEFNVITGNPGEQYGRTSAGVISAITRSGTDHIHGSAYEYFRNSAMDARNYYDSLQIPPFNRNQFGASLGGPLWKNTFLFGDYEGIRQSLSQDLLNTVPSPSARAGQICSMPAGNNCTPTTVTVDPAVTKFLNTFIPQAQSGTIFGNGDIGTFSFAGKSVTSEDFVTTRFDHVFSPTNSVSVDYLYDNASTYNPDNFDVVNIESETVRQMAAVMWTLVLGPNAVNTVHSGFSRDNAGVPYNATAINPAAADLAYGFQPTDAVGGVTVPGMSSFSGGTTSQAPLLYRWNSFQGYDDATVTRGVHTIDFGASMERIDDNQKTEDNPGGTFSFASLSDFLTNQPQSFLTTLPISITPRNLRQNIFAVYLGDTMHLRPYFTLNLGVRYEIASVPYEINGKLSNLRVLQGDTPYLGNPYIKNPTFGNVEPHVGFAWDPFHDGKTSIRSAFGIYDILPYMVEMGPGVDSVTPFAYDASAANLPVGTFPTGAYPIVANNPALRKYSALQYAPPRNYVMTWNLNIQRALGSNTTLLVGYVGSRGIHMWYQTDDGNIVLPTYNPTTHSYYWPTPIGSGTVVDPLVGRVFDASWSGDSYYDGGEAQLNEFLNHGLVGSLAYTYSRCIDTSSGSAASDQYRNSLNVGLYIAPRTRRGLCDTNVSQNLVTNLMWSAPDRASGSSIRWLTNGWKIGGILTASSGPPFSVIISGDPLGTNSAVPFDFPDRVKGCGPLTTSNPKAYINLKCFAFPNPVNRMGNAGRNELIGPSLFNLDFSIIRDVPFHKITQQGNLEFRFETFNVLNHTNFSAPTDNFSLYDGSGNPVPGAGLIDQTVTTSRQLQLAVKLTF
jgi:Carboxypeptidase regulatory-like domain/TonB-dependent Receptor Plug Domain